MAETGITHQQADRIIYLLEKIEDHLDSLVSESSGIALHTSSVLDTVRDISLTVNGIERNQG